MGGRTHLSYFVNRIFFLWIVRIEPVKFRLERKVSIFLYKQAKAKRSNSVFGCNQKLSIGPKTNNFLNRLKSSDSIYRQKMDKSIIARIHT